MTLAAVVTEAAERGVTRLCHFTPFRNAHHIFGTRSILCSTRVKLEHPASYKPTDERRLDQRESHVCTNLEYPNVWYLDRVQAKDDVFVDYLLFLIKPRVLGLEGVQFCTGNAARGRGIFCATGAAAFSALFASTVQGNTRYNREKGHPSWLPTDMQAEVLIPGEILFADVIGVVVKTKTIAKRLVSQLKLANTMLDLPLLVSPGMFGQASLRALRTGGPRPAEEPYPS